jgi:hypothetical protein
MIPFFRKIRYKLAQGNQPASPAGRFFKYSRYALGEIALVVLGILIALQINTWNGQRLERNEEVKILKGIKKDLENTIQEFEFHNQIRSAVLDATKRIYTLADSNELPEEELDSLIGLTFYRPTFNNQLGFINLLFTSGKINLIKSDSIREFLIQWPGAIEDMIEEEDYALLMLQNHYYPTLAKYLVVQDLLDQGYSISFIGTEIKEEGYADAPFESDYEGLMNDKLFLNHLRMRASHFAINNNESRALIAKGEEMIRTINLEIDEE